jgi:hypothetical protein
MFADSGAPACSVPSVVGNGDEVAAVRNSREVAVDDKGHCIPVLKR